MQRELESRAGFRWLEPLVATSALLLLWLAWAEPVRWTHWVVEPQELDETQASRLVDRLTAMRRTGNWRAALDAAQRLQRAYPENPIYLGHLGEIFSRLGNSSEEAAAWGAFFEVAPLRSEACPQWGRALEKAGRPQEAVQAHERCLAAEPDSPDLLYALAAALDRRGDIVRAAGLFADGARKFPRNPDFAVAVARAELRGGHPDKTRELLNPFLAASPDNVDALLMRGLACQRLGDAKAAVKDLERGVRLAPAYLDYYLPLAMLAEQRGDEAGAVSWYRKLLAARPDDEEAMRRLRALVPGEGS